MLRSDHQFDPAFFSRLIAKSLRPSWNYFEDLRSRPRGRKKLISSAQEAHTNCVTVYPNIFHIISSIACKRFQRARSELFFPPRENRIVSPHFSRGQNIKDLPRKRLIRRLFRVVKHVALSSYFKTKPNPPRTSTEEKQISLRLPETKSRENEKAEDGRDIGQKISHSEGNPRYRGVPLS